MARIGDGLVALPADARTREHVDWIADEIVEAVGSAGVWLATPASRQQERELAAAMREARTAEYQSVTDAAALAAAGLIQDRARVARRLRDELRRIDRRDFFPPPHRDVAHAAVADLAATGTETEVAAHDRRSAR